MSGTLLCYVFGFSSGFFCRLLTEKKCNSSQQSSRIHHFQTEYTIQEISGENYDNLTITEQPQQAIQYNGELSLPTAQAHIVRDT